MAWKPYTVAQFDAQDPTHVSHHARRVLARLALSAGFREALRIDPSLATELWFVNAATDNAVTLAEEVIGI